jgi:hypothetical protein
MEASLDIQFFAYEFKIKNNATFIDDVFFFIFSPHNPISNFMKSFVNLTILGNKDYELFKHDCAWKIFKKHSETEAAQRIHAGRCIKLQF